MSIETADMLLGGKIRIERVIGEGAMGIVYLASDTALKRRVAVKVIAPDLVTDERTRKRFEREAQAASQLKSEHSVRVLEVDANAAEPYLVMEYLEGRSLESIVLKDGRVQALTAIDWILQALVALEEAHSLGLVHRDIKPANLFLTNRPGHEPIVKVLDFGLVKDLDPRKPRLTKTGASMGTPAYMSPEQVRAIPDIDARADIWAIGASLYELLTGNLPFIASTLPDLLTAIVQGETKPLREGRPDIPVSIEPVVQRCLAKDRRDRYGSVAELTRAIETALSGPGGTLRLDPPSTLPDSAPSPLAPTQPSAYAPLGLPDPGRAQATPTPAAAATPPATAPLPPVDFSHPRHHVALPDVASSRRPRSVRERPQSFALIFVIALLAVVILGALGFAALVLLAPQLFSR